MGRRRRRPVLPRGMALVACLLGIPASAAADCQPDPAPSGATVTCSALDADGFSAGVGVNTLSVDVERQAEVRDAAPGGVALGLNDGNTVTIAPSDLVEPMPGDPPVEEAGGRISVSGAGSQGISAGDGNRVTHDGVFSVTGDGAVGIEMGFNNTIDIVDTGPAETEATRFDVTGSAAIGIRVDDGNRVTNGGLFTVGGQDATGIRVESNNTVVNRAVLEVSGARAVGIDVRGLMNGVDNAAGATLVVSGDDAVGARLANGGDSLFNFGEIQVSGAGATGLQGGDDVGGPLAGIGNRAGGRIEVTGAAAAAIAIGDDGVLANTGEIVVGDAATGSGASGIRVNARNTVFAGSGGVIDAAGMDSAGVRLTGDENTVEVRAGSRIDASGENAIGIVGPAGNSVLIVGSVSATGAGSVGVELSGAGSTLDNSLTNRGTLSASDAAAAAVRFSGGGSSASSLTNEAAGLIDASAGLAVEGGDAVERITNRGTIRGAVALGAGDDSFRQAGGSLEGSLDGGDGSDALELLGAAIDLGVVSNFETLSILASPQISTLMGSASLAGGVEVEADAALRVDGAVGVTGSYLQRSGAALHVQLLQTDDPAPGLASDRLSVGGAATLEDGSILDVELVDPATPRPMPSGVVTVLEASGGLVAGELLLRGLPTESAVLSFTPGVDASGRELQLTVARLPYADFGGGNGGRMGAYLDGLLPDASGDVAGLLAGLDGLGAAALAEGLGTLQPEAYDASTSTALAAGLEFTRRLHDRPLECGTLRVPELREVKTLSTCGELGIAPWLDLSALGTSDGGSSLIDFDHFGGLSVLGVDARPARSLLLSASLGGSYNWIRADDSRGELATIDAGAAFAARVGPLRLRGAASYGRAFHSLERSVRLGTSRLDVDGDWESDRVTLLGSVAWPLAFWNWSLAPELQIDYAHLFEQAVRESGGPAGLVVDDRSNGLLGVGGLLRLSSSSLWLGDIKRIPEWWHGTFTRSFYLGMRGVPMGADRDLEARFGSAGPGSSVRVQAEDAAWLVRAGLGLGFQPWAYAASVSASYGVDIGDGTLLQRLSVRLHVPF